MSRIPGDQAIASPVEDFECDSDLFAETVRAPQAQERIAAATKRGLQTRDGEMTLGRELVMMDCRPTEELDNVQPPVPLSYDVFVAPEKPFNAPPPRVGDPPAWDPTTSTLIFGARDAVLVDALMTVREATALADWIALHDRRLTTIYITHGHGDHYLGLSVLLDRFPSARAVATRERWSRCASTPPRRC